MKKNQVFFTLLMILAIGAGNMQAATAKWYNNGIEIASQDAEAGTALNIPANPIDEFAGGYTFAGWTTEPIEGKAAVAPTLVNTTGLQMPENDINYYAVFGREEQKTVIANAVELAEGKDVELTSVTQLGLDNTWTISTTACVSDQTVKVLLRNVSNLGGKFIAFSNYKSSGPTMTVTAPAPNTIECVRLSFTGADYSKAAVIVENDTIVPVNGSYAINANSFTISAINDGGKQVRITQIDVIFASASYATTFTKPNPDIYWSNYDTEIILLGYSATPAVRSIVNPHNLPVRYRSGDSSVMEVNPTTGVITPKAMGYASMFVVFDGNEEYAAGHASYPVRVYGYDHIELSGEATKTAYEAGDPFSRAGIVANAVYVLTNQANRNLNVTDMAEWSVSPTYVTEDGNIAVTATWQEKTSEAVDVAVTVIKHAVTFEAPENGTLVIKNGETPIASGDVFAKGTILTIEATPASADYKAGVVTVTGATLEGNTITVGSSDITVSAVFAEKADPVLSWSATEATYIYGEVNALPTLTNDPQLVITFESTNTSVATIDQEGNVYPQEVTGTTIIKAIYAGDDDYKAKTVSYTLNVKVAQTPKYYVAGNEEFTGYDWSSNKVVSYEDSYTFENVPAGSHVFKLSMDGTWGNMKGFGDLTQSEIIAGLYPGDNGNIHFTLAEAGDVTITYNEEVFKVSGNFTPQTVKLAGDWDWKAPIDANLSDDRKSATVTKTFDAGTWVNFKMVVDGKWLGWSGEGYALTRSENTASGLINDGNNLYFQADVTGEYQFTWIFGFNQFVLTFPSKGGGTAVDNVNGEKVNDEWTKVLRNGQIFILRGNKTYTIDGQMVK